jgi:hypothetical protein
VPTKLVVGRVWEKQCSTQKRVAADRMERVKMRIFMVDFKEGAKKAYRYWFITHPKYLQGIYKIAGHENQSDVLGNYYQEVK